MSDLIDALDSLLSRVRTDISAVKRDGKMFWTEEPVTKERLLQHVNGGAARGVCPIKEGETTTKVALLDFDSHKGQTPWQAMAKIAQLVIGELARHGIKAIPWRSSGGKGVHLY